MTNPERPDRPEAADGMEGLVSRSLSRRKFVAGAASMTSLAVLLAACGDGRRRLDQRGGALGGGGARFVGGARIVGGAGVVRGARIVGGRDGGADGVEHAHGHHRAAEAGSRARHVRRPGRVRRAPSATSTRWTPRKAARSTACASCARTARRRTSSSSRCWTSPGRSSRRASRPARRATSSCSRRRRASRSSSSRPTPADEYSENLRNASTKNGSFDLVTSAIEEVGDFAEAGLLLPLDEFVAKYQPQLGTIPSSATSAARRRSRSSTSTRARPTSVAFDNDTQPYFYRADLFTNPDEQKAFEDKYGRPLTFPRRGSSRPRSPSSSPGRTPTRRSTATSRRWRRSGARQLEPAVRVLPRTRTCSTSTRTPRRTSTTRPASARSRSC